MKMAGWEVFEDGDLIDTVYFIENCDGASVRQMLIEHDSYSPTITIKEVVWA